MDVKELRELGYWEGSKGCEGVVGSGGFCVSDQWAESR